MTSLPFGSVGFLSVRDDWGSGDGGGLNSIGADAPGLGWAVDDGDSSYLRWVSHVLFPGGHSYAGYAGTFEGETNRAIVEFDWVPGSLDITSDLTLTVVVHKIGGGYLGPAFVFAAIWRFDGTDVKSFGLPNMDGSDDYVTLTGTIPSTHEALDWLLNEEAFIALRWANQDAASGGEVANAAGDEFRYTRITLDYDTLGGAPSPRVRQRQVPR